jgi:uncharacterized protein YdbL (DUF1318 family)
MFRKLFFISICLCFVSNDFGQTTQFTYQGSLPISGARKGEMRMFRKEKTGFILRSLVFLLLLINIKSVAAQHTYNGNNYGDAYSKMLVVTSDMQTNMFNTINRVNSARREMFPELAGASRVTPQEIANLCKPFPCGNEGMVSRPGPITQQDIQRLCGPFPCGTETTPSRPQPNYVPPPRRQYPITATDFRPMGGRIIPDAVAASAQGDAQTKEAVRALANQFLDAFEKEGRRNNVANGFGFLSSVSIQVATGRELTEVEEQQLIAGFNNMLAASPQFGAISARDKQLATEASVISGGFIAFLHVQGQQTKDAKMQADARQLATAAIAYFFGVQIR